MRILYCGNFANPWNTEVFVARALDRAGHAVTRLQLGNNAQDVPGILRASRSCVPEVVLFSKPHALLPEDVSNLRRGCRALFAQWIFDLCRDFPGREWFVPLARNMDIVFMTDGGNLDYYREQGINVRELKQGIDPDAHRPRTPTPEERIRYETDIAFVGGADRRVHPRRYELLQRVSSRFRLRIFGEGTAPVWNEDLAKLCASAKIILGHSYRNDIRRYWSNRVYLTLGCGGFFVTEYVPGLEEDFTDGEHLVWYHDEDELMEILEHYLDEGMRSERDSIALSGCREVHERHTFDRRVEVLISEIEAMRKDRIEQVAAGVCDHPRGPAPKIAMMGYLCLAGVGVINHQLAERLDVENFLALRHPGKGLVDSWMKGSFTLAKGSPPGDRELREFFDKAQAGVFLVNETPYNPRAFFVAHECGMKCVFIPMWESFDGHNPLYRDVDLFLCPTKKCLEVVRQSHDNAALIPLPVDVECLPYRQRPNDGVFLHNAGWGGVNHRKGTNEVLRAFAAMKRQDATLIVNTQAPVRAFEAYGLVRTDERIRWKVGSTDDRPSLYEHGFVAVQPSRFEGVGLTIPESMACGLPVITTDAAPMNEFVNDARFLVPAKETKVVSLMNPAVPMHIADVERLTERMEWCMDNDMQPCGKAARAKVEAEYGWSALKARWLEALEGVLRGAQGTAEAKPGAGEAL